jgi:lipopolysaccharide transport system ATP-binding protein
MQDVIVVENLSKRFRRRRAARPATLKEALISRPRWRVAEEDFWALRDVSFRVPAGQMIGVIGPNGAGKSTLLRLIGGVGRPDAGRVTVQGRLGTLLDLGVGFHPDLTGRENIFIDGVIAGLTRQEIGRRFDAIVAFSELEEFIDAPLRTYSSGMWMRLAFSVAAHMDPEILLMDEILSVGDLAFQKKCLDRIVHFQTEGTTILLVSHDPNAVQQLCDQVLWLRRGQLVAYGPPEIVVGQYVAEMSAETRRRTPEEYAVVGLESGATLRVNENRFGSLEMEIVAVRLLDREGLPIAEIDSGDALTVEIAYLAPSRIEGVIFGATISRDDGTICYDTSTQAGGGDIVAVEGAGQICLHMERLDLIGGQHYVDVGVYQREWAYAYDYHWHVYPLLVRPTQGEKGIVRPPTRWEFGPAPEARAPAVPEETR